MHRGQKCRDPSLLPVLFHSPACHSYLISAITFTCFLTLSPTCPHSNLVIPLTLCQIVFCIMPSSLTVISRPLPWFQPCLSLTHPHRPCPGNMASFLSLTPLPARFLSVSCLPGCVDFHIAKRPSPAVDSCSPVYKTVPTLLSVCVGPTSRLLQNACLWSLSWFNIRDRKEIIKFFFLLPLSVLGVLRSNWPENCKTAWMSSLHQRLMLCQSAVNIKVMSSSNAILLKHFLSLSIVAQLAHTRCFSQQFLVTHHKTSWEILHVRGNDSLQLCFYCSF